MSDVWSRAWCETQNVPNFALKGKQGNFSCLSDSLATEFGPGHRYFFYFFFSAPGKHV